MLLYINQVEAARSELIPPGPVNYLTGTTTYIPNDVENNFFNYSVPNTMFVAGENIIAIEVHQQIVSSSDVSFDCSFNGDYTTGVFDEADMSFDFQLSQNYPNPFNPSTTIEFTVPKSGFYSLKVYNLAGQEIADLISNNLSVGSHSIVFESDNLSSGIYIYKLVGENVEISKRMVLLK